VEFCEHAYTVMDSDIVDLPSFLITPVQRIPRYQVSPPLPLPFLLNIVYVLTPLQLICI